MATDTTAFRVAVPQQCCGLTNVHNRDGRHVSFRHFSLCLGDVSQAVSYSKCHGVTRLLSFEPVACQHNGTSDSVDLGTSAGGASAAIGEVMAFLAAEVAPEFIEDGAAFATTWTREPGADATERARRGQEGNALRDGMSRATAVTCVVLQHDARWLDMRDMGADRCAENPTSR